MPTPTRAVVAPLSAMMFLQFFVWGAWYVTVGNYMANNGMKDGIAWAYTVCPIAAIISPIFLGMIADRFFATERVLAVLHLLGGAAMLLAPRFADTANYWPFIAILLFHALCYMPTLGLTGTLGFAHLSDPQKQFPIIRVFGTLGWIAANWVVSKGFSADTTAAQFYVAGAAGLALGLYSFFLPHTPPPAKGKPFSIRDALGLDALALMKVPSFFIFILCSFLICIPLASYYASAPVFAATIWKETAFYMSFGQVSEIFFMVVMPLCFARLGVKWMLAAGMIAWGLRYGLFSAAAGAPNASAAWMVLAGIVLHGICYDFFFVAGQVYVEQQAPANIRGQAQGFIVLVTQGAGMLVGAQVGGALLKAYTTGPAGATITDWRWIWAILAIASVAVTLFFAATFREKKLAVP